MELDVGNVDLWHVLIIAENFASTFNAYADFSISIKHWLTALRLHSRILFKFANLVSCKRTERIYPSRIRPHLVFDVADPMCKLGSSLKTQDIDETYHYHSLKAAASFCLVTSTVTYLSTFSRTRSS